MSDPAISGYCMKEHKSIRMKNPINVVAKNGRTMIKGKCPDCGTNVSKYGKLIDCPNCQKVREGVENDYICRWCRIDA